MNRALALAAPVLAAPDDNIPPGQGPEWGKAAPIGLLIILLLGLALFFLIKNMNKQFRKVPVSFDPPEPEVADLEPAGDDQAAEPPGAAGQTAADEVAPAVEPAVIGGPGDQADEGTPTPQTGERPAGG